MAVEAGTRLGNVVVREYVAAGIAGTVYRAVDAGRGVVVVKVLHSLSDPECRARFREVAQRLTAVSHANLVRVLAHGEYGDVPYLVEENVEGVTLAERFRRASMGPIPALEILRGLAAGIDHAHTAGLVHGRLEPGQVLLADRPLLSDIGLAPLLHPRLDEPTGATDRYAFATIAYQLLVDRAPFEGDTATEPPAPSHRNRALPSAVDAVLLRGLAREAADRWPACSPLVEELAKALEVPPPAPDRGGRRRPLFVAGGMPDE